MKKTLSQLVSLLLSPGGIALFSAGVIASIPLLQTRPRPTPVSTPLAAVVEKPVAQMDRKPVHRTPRKSVAKKAKAQARRKAEAREWQRREKQIDEALAQDGEDAFALNSFQPELAIAQNDLQESPAEKSDYRDPQTTAAQLDVELALGLTFPTELPYLEKVGLFQRNTFPELRASLEALRDPEFFPAEAKPAPELVVPRKVAAKKMRAKGKADRPLAKARSPKPAAELAAVAELEIKNVASPVVESATKSASAATPATAPELGAGLAAQPAPESLSPVSAVTAPRLLAGLAAPPAQESVPTVPSPQDERAAEPAVTSTFVPSEMAASEVSAGNASGEVASSPAAPVLDATAEFARGLGSSSGAADTGPSVESASAPTLVARGPSLEEAPPDSSDLSDEGLDEGTSDGVVASSSRSEEPVPLNTSPPQTAEEAVALPSADTAVALPEAAGDGVPPGFGAPAATVTRRRTGKAPAFLSYAGLQPSILAALPKPRLPGDDTSESVSSPTKTASRTATPSAGFHTALADRPFDHDFFGRLEIRPDFQRWLEANNAHVETSLQPIGTRDARDTRYLSYMYPQENFREQQENLRGRYRLVAGVFTPKSVDAPYAEIVCPVEVNAETTRGHIKCSLDLDDLKPNENAPHVARRHANVSVSFFEGATPEHRKPVRIPGVEVRLVGFPNLGVFRASDDGNLTLPALPNQSQIVLEARAKGYYRTFRTVPVFGSDVYTPTYLVAKNEVKELTRKLVGVRQSGALSVVMGRAFDPQTRNPLADEVLELVDHPEENGSFFSFLGMPMVTAVTGFLSYYNVTSAFRYLRRVNSDKRTLRLFVAAASGYYVELARGGMTSLRAHVSDPNGGRVGGATVTLVGDQDFSTVTDDKGYFEIPGIDFPAGVITIQVSAPGYSTTWHTLPWDVKHAGIEREIFVLQDRFTEQSLADSQSSDFGPNPTRFEQAENLGNIIAGAYGGLFEQTGKCLSAELWSLETGRRVESAHGPYPFLRPDVDSSSLCLTPEKPGVKFVDLPPAAYLLKWIDGSDQALGVREVHVGMGRSSILVN